MEKLFEASEEDFEAMNLGWDCFGKTWLLDH